MIEHPIEGDYRNWILNAFRQTTLFAVLDAATMEQMTQFCRLVELEAGEYLTREGDASDNFYVILIGEALVTATDQVTGEQLELERIAQHESVGELGMLLQSRSLTLLETLVLYKNELGDEGIEALSISLKDSKSLATLDLSNGYSASTKFGPKGATALASAIAVMSSLTTVRWPPAHEPMPASTLPSHAA